MAGPTPDSFDHMTFASLLAGAIALMKVLEKFIDWTAKKIGGDKAGKVELAAEPSRLIRDTYDKTSKVEEIMTLRDRDGIPMVYTPRSALENQVKMAEAIRDVSQSNARLSESYEEISQRVADILAQVKK